MATASARTIATSPRSKIAITATTAARPTANNPASDNADDDNSSNNTHTSNKANGQQPVNSNQQP
eukprot:15443053-Alexandrium_andersonii.AAC.1